jgi:serine/threonine-protein kinase HipA
VRNLEEAKRVQRAVIYKNGVAAATIERNARTGVVFSYLPAYLDAGGQAIAATLPALNTPVKLAHGTVPAFFAGLLPEGERLAKLRWMVKTTLADEMSLLIAAGQDPVGDVQILPSGATPAEPEPLAILPADLSDFSFARFDAGAGPVDPSSLPGVQNKVSAGLLGARGRRRYILKMDSPGQPHQVAAEYLLLTKARALGVPVVQPRLLTDAGGAKALLLPRFDRTTAGRLAVEDGAQLLGLTPGRKNDVSAEAVAGAVINRCAAGPLAARNVYLLFLFAWLTGNGNLHAKNISVLQHATGEWLVAPAYDLQCTLAADVEEGIAAGVPGGILTDLTDGDPSRDPGMALRLGGSRTRLDRAEWLRFARALNLPERLAAKCITKALAASLLTAAELPFEREVSSAVVRVLAARRAPMEP